MVARDKYRPFTGDSETSVRLDAAPLVLVLFQFRWPTLGQLQKAEQLKHAALTLSEALVDYPLYTENQSINYTITPTGVSSDVMGSIHEWVSVDGIWHVALSNQSLSLYCTIYQGYDEVERRLRALLTALPNSIPVPLVDRVGVRYVNRISDDQDLSNLEALVLPEILGHRPSPVNGGASLVASINQAAYNVDGASLQVRSGILAPNDTPDAAIPALQKQSWVLDIDASLEKRIPFEVNAIISEFSRMSDLAYDYFKSISTPEFIERFSKKG